MFSLYLYLRRLYSAFLFIDTNVDDVNIPINLIVNDAILLGDMNGDEIINVLDVNVLVNIALGHIGSVEDVAAAVIFLASSAAGMITGESLKVDGGWTAW